MTNQDSDRIKEEKAKGKWQVEPSSSLHTKLQAILDDEVNNPIREGEGVDPKSYFGIDNDDIIAQILQAFQEAGWVTPENVQKVQGMVNQMANLANDAFHLPTIQYIKPNLKTMTSQNLMTGQEFYDRFKAELDKENLNLGGDAELAVAKAVKLCNDAARRAAGIA